MQCPNCGSPDASGETCQRCGYPLDATLGMSADWSRPAARPEAGSSGETIRSETILAGRYEILERIGHGGMGNVLKAYDRELERIVALKVLRPELAQDPDMLRRFRSELRLAQKVVHKNVARIYDIGTARNRKFISMEYLEGSDLRKVLKSRGKLTPAEALPIIRQVCAGLEAAHSVKVIHRDLKPPNLMMGPDGTVVIMDFGLARSVDAMEKTQTVALMGTPPYMSPEQAEGKPLDGRSDLFALGIIAYEMLSGIRPLEADSVMATLLKRTREDALPLAEVAPDIPKPLSDVVMKCLQRDVEARYQSAGELLQDLEKLEQPPPPKPRSPFFWMATAAGILILAAGLFFYRGRNVAPPAKVLGLLVADFENTTQDPVFTGTVEQMLTIAMEGAPWISAYDRRKARQIAGELRSGATSLDESLARLVAIRESIQDVITGSIAQQGGGYWLSVRAVDAASGKRLAEASTRAASKVDVLAAVGDLAGRIRKGLDPHRPQPRLDPFTAGNIEAAHFYVLGQEMQYQGKGQEAIANYQHAIALDPNLGRAYAGLAVSYRNAGQKEEAIRNFQAAMSRLDRMTDREKYRTRGAYYVMVGNADKAVEEFSRLLQEYPADNSALANLALAYFLRHDMLKALEIGRRAAEKFPDIVTYKNNVAFYAMYAGDFGQAVRTAEQALKLNPHYEKGFIAMALSQLADGKPDEAVKTYERLAQVSPRGASWAALGLADAALYAGHNAEAIAILERGTAADLRVPDRPAASSKYLIMARAHISRRENARAQSDLARADLTAAEPAVLYPAAIVYLDIGAAARANEIAALLAQNTEAEPRLYAKLIEGEVQLRRKNANQALDLFHEAQKIADSWAGRLALGRAYIESAKFPEAHSELELCLKRRGEATALFLNDMPTYHFFPPVYYYLGRTQEGLKSPGAAASYRSFLAIKATADHDAMIDDALRRLAALSEAHR